MILPFVGLLMLSVSKVSSYNCTVPTGFAQPADGFPDLLDSYQTDIEINYVDQGTTTDIEEYLDYPGNRGLVTYFENGVGYRYIYSYNTDEIFYIDESAGTCQVLNLTTSRQSALFGNNERDGIPHIFTARDALRFGKKYGQVFVGTSRVRGIDTSHWKACMATPGMNFTADYYFTAGNWITASSSPQVPVRIELQGIQTFSNSTAPKPFHRIYDFFRFRADSTVDTTYFETPKGMICPGRVTTKAIPTLPSYYYFRQETIVPGAGTIGMSDIWYDYDYKLVRADSRQDGYGPPFYTPNPVTEIHDYTAGVRYLKDHVTGNCSVWPLQNGSFDADRNIQAFKVNNSYVLHMKNPMALFGLAGNFTYTGVRAARGGVLCDVYTSVQPNYIVSGIPMNATMEFYFLSDGWSEYPNVGLSGYQDDYPYQIEITVSEAAYHVVINILDFNADHPRLTSFDISDCYPDTAKLHFRTRFPGPYSPDTENFLIDAAHIQMSTLLNISPLRLQRFSIETDHSNMFINAILVDTVPDWAEFTYLPGKVVERQDDLVINDVIDPRNCATWCNTYKDFTCNSFDFCISDKTCRLSHAHVGDGSVAKASVKCDHFSRTLSTGTTAIPLMKAFSHYRSLVYTNQMYFDVTNDNGNDQVYTANDVEITFGWMNKVPMPSLGDQFSYRFEAIVPQYKYVTESAIWYDAKNQLVRFDMRNSVPNTVFYSPTPMTYIQDFKTGIVYSINKVGGNCTVSSINPYLASDVDLNKGVTQKTGYVLHLKGPLEMFRMGVSFAFAGQKTVRGILCNVFEAVIPDYRIVGTNVTSRATLQYFFQARDWGTTSDAGAGTTTSQPVMIRHYTDYNKMFMTMNIFDFRNNYLDLSVFDIRKCFNDNQKHHFEITFSQPFHPYLDDRKTDFLLAGRQFLSDVTRSSALRFQNLDLTYNLQSVYLLVTLLEVPDFMLHFHKLPGQHPARQTKLKVSSVRTANECAQACIQQVNFVCNSFDYCPSTSQCMFSTTHVPDGHLIPGQTSVMCTHYSRSVNGTGPELSMMRVYETVKDVVYKGEFVLPMLYDGSKTFKYTATGVRDTIIRPDSAQPSGGDFLQQYKVYRKRAMKHDDFVLSGLAVDDCATACTEEIRFDCQSFDYCYTTGTCSLSRSHPDPQPGGLQHDDFCDLYAKKYLMNYKLYPGQVMVTKADVIASDVNSADMCAKTCSTSTKITCRSFDFCSEMKNCRLHKKHILDMPVNSLVGSPMCYHYSRDYVYDFSQKRQVVIKGNDNIVVDGVSKMQCAKMCVDQSDIECRSFEFCPNTSTCVLSQAHVKAATHVQIEASQTCNLYLRKTLTDGTPYDPKGALHYGKTTSDKSAKVGLALGMLILGAVISAVATLSIIRLKSRNEDHDMKVEFVNNPEADSS